MPIIKKKSKSHKISILPWDLISLPIEIRENLKINGGDMLDIRIEGNKIVMEPLKPQQ